MQAQRLLVATRMRGRETDCFLAVLGGKRYGAILAWFDDGLRIQVDGGVKHEAAMFVAEGADVGAATGQA
jgi:pentose-5-phosphate-3-epimerase